MSGKFVFSLMATLLVCSSALASVGQTQSFFIGAANDITRSGCVGSAENRNMATVGHAQRLNDASHGTTLRQHEEARLFQSGKATGSGGKDVITQRASVEGGQGQYVRAGRSGMRTEEQSLSANLETSISHKAAVGRAEGAQRVVGSQSQRETTPNGFSQSNQSFRASQFTAVSGGPRSNVRVNGTVDVSLSQDHFVSGRP